MLVKHVGGSVGQGMRAEFMPTGEPPGESGSFPRLHRPNRVRRNGVNGDASRNGDLHRGFSQHARPNAARRGE